MEAGPQSTQHFYLSLGPGVSSLCTYKAAWEIEWGSENIEDKLEPTLVSSLSPC